MFTKGDAMLVGVKVAFKERGYWSKAYTYTYSQLVNPIKAGDVVVVPTSDFYSVGRVTEVIENFNPNPADQSFEYKSVILKLDLE